MKEIENFLKDCVSSSTKATYNYIIELKLRGYVIKKQNIVGGNMVDVENGSEKNLT
ncbi:MAG: hypothetical protein AB1420_15965 [Bacillota bacterium]